MTLYIKKIGIGKPVVMLHGWGFDHQIWLPWLDHLMGGAPSQSYEFHLVDLPGYGQSPPLAWSEFKATLLAQLPEKFVLMGWSLGGMMATRLSIEAPERITHLVNVASSPRFTAAPDWIGVESTLFDDFYQKFMKNPALTREYFIRTQLQGQPLPSTISMMQLSHQGLAQGLDYLKTWDLREQLSLIRVPVTYVLGRLDALIPHRLMAYMQPLYPHFNYIMIEKSAHIPFLSHPIEFNTCLETF